MRTINLIWEVQPRELGKSWLLDQVKLFEVMPNGSRERVEVIVTQEQL